MKISPLGERVLAGALALAAVMLWSSWRTAQRNSDAMKAVLAARAREIESDREQVEKLNSDIAKANESASRVEAETKKPAQILRKLPTYLPLPKPLEPAYRCTDVASSICLPTYLEPKSPADSPGMPGLRHAVNDTAFSGSTTPDIQAPDDGSGPPIVLPQEDLKPLFDFSAECKACQIVRDAQGREILLLGQEVEALKAERDAAVKASKGGRFWSRLKSNAHWFVIGGAVAAGAICATGHCK
jgi:hypothetical protein